MLPRAVNGTSAAPNGTVGIPSRAGHHRIDIAAAALRADQPLAPVERGRSRAVPSSHLGGIGVDLVRPFLAPHHDRCACRVLPEGSRVGRPISPPRLYEVAITPGWRIEWRDREHPAR
jgi:hypothetical protein